MNRRLIRDIVREFLGMGPASPVTTAAEHRRQKAARLAAEAVAWAEREARERRAAEREFLVQVETNRALLEQRRVLFPRDLW
jgi:hypothetical protein